MLWFRVCVFTVRETCEVVGICNTLSCWNAIARLMVVEIPLDFSFNSDASNLFPAFCMRAFPCFASDVETLSQFYWCVVRHEHTETFPP